MMFSNLSEKKKFNAVVIGIFILLILAFMKSFKPTYNTIAEYISAKQMIGNTDEVAQELREFSRKTEELDISIGKQVEKPELVQNEILAFLSDSDSKIRVANIDKIHVSEDEYFRIYSNTLILEGNYNALSKAVYDFETKFEYARIANIKFYTEKNRKTREKELFTKIIFQNYEKID
ncbi:MAG: hypothetical protein ACSHW7_00535 [Patiriisocius sp.]|uniref:hypothetical protein n=1 Tax=Patiriisocius sp. TaxID=2822396 RepID=UPI003EF28F83